ncbi:MAG TPA: HAMP domain-containing sensor histidine kinase [Candidatus Dormibacteraeota bacterium]|nr:HAMP domain-containing sensor histidine kinase [Candidatus Dormibacteraeota bacterium]
MNRLARWLDIETAFRHRIPIRARIALFGAGVVAFTVVIFSVLVYYLVQGNLTRQQDVALAQRGEQVWQFLERGGRFSRGPFFPPVDLNISSEPFVQIFSAQGASIDTSGTIDNVDPQWPGSTFNSVPLDHGIFETVQPAGGPRTRAYVRAWSRPDLGLSGYMIVGQPIPAIEGQLDGLRLFLLAGALLSLLGAGALSWFVAGRALRPLDEMATAAETIGRTQDLSRRLPVNETNDEVGRLQRSFNQMLGQLEDAYQRLRSALLAQRRFVADASHELRTPLTTIRGNIGLLMKREDITTEDRTAALHDIASESERMSRLVQDLLTLARADAGYHLEKVPLDLQPILQDVTRQAQKIQPARRVDLLDGQSATVHANADAIKQLLWILIDNAFKHTNDGGHIQLTLQPGNQWTSLVVSDDGPGIPQQDVERIFERFYQSDAARTGEGTGLGLAIARWIAHEHGGRVFAGNNPQGGARFTVQLPVAAKS